MDPRHNYNWPPQPYANGQYVPYTPPQQQPNGYAPQGYPPQYPPMQMQMPQGYPQSQPQQGGPQVAVPRPSSQQYPPMPQAYPQQQQPRAQPQVVIPARAPNYSSPMQQMQPPKIRHVQMPVQRTSNGGMVQMDGSHDRRSFNGRPAPPPSVPKQVQRSHSHQENGPRPQQRTPSTPTQNQHQHRAPLQQQTAPQQRALPADLSVMLLSAADEYIAAARGIGALIVREKREADMRQYYKLMATGLGCMDTVLREFSLMPRDEAKLRLRYASLLVEETDNTAEIDEILSKQISLCGRCRLQDLKYASLHLQVRYQFKTNHRAALKALDKPISEAETFQHIAWVYAFRFLKVSLALQIPGRIETVPALQQLHAILAHAEKRGDRAIYVACTAMEAMVHLRSGAPDRLEQAHRAIAAARSQQLLVAPKQLGSFGTLIDIIDVAWGIQHGTPDSKKSTALIEAALDETTVSARSETGVFTVVVERSFGGSLTYDTGGVFRKSSDGKDELVFGWLPREDVKTLCFHISALDQNVHEKGLSYVKEAHQRSRAALKRNISYSIPLSIAVSQTEWNRVLDWHSMFTIGLIASFREDHGVAKEALTILRKRAAKPPYDSQETYTRTLSYLAAVVDQKSGSLESASRTYATETFQLPEKSLSGSARTDLAILAALNRLLIIRSPGYPQHHMATALLQQIQPFCENHPNQYVQMAHRLIRAMFSSDASINRQKTLMQTASNRANEIFRNTQNREFVIMALCYFTMSFFADQVGEKSIQAIRATRQNAKLSRKPLWMAVAFGLCMSTYQRNGLIEDAQKAQQEYEEIKHLLPAPLTGGDELDAEGEDDS
ncbi:cohesin loading factor-domain-containing protein [Paraphoma chrysanthemicola]|uniref:Cohesin loading factor-domain-containing protein n=1 Tax=Paraphoma chrysanthemicola TaxID=798071 RepID=A0A8K0R9H5_9PLEO|nr:cohesin loading factor-domain-containing protein [Paraphoma chrysanthemicola]